MNAIQLGRYGWSSYNSSAQLMPLRNSSFGEEPSRVTYYDIAEGYRYGTVYSQFDPWAISRRTEKRWYKNIRMIKNPIGLVIELLASYTYRGSIDMDNPHAGALPLKYDDSLDEQIKLLIKWTGLDQLLAPIVSYAALYGDAPIWIAIDPKRQRVRLDLLHPSWIKHAEYDEAGNIKMAVIEYDIAEPLDITQISQNGKSVLPRPKQFTYRMVVTKETFTTYKNGERFAYYEDDNGQLQSEWVNEYGFVPLKIAHYDRGKDGWGRNCFFGALDLLDEYNDQRSLFDDSVRNTVVPILQATGISSAAEIRADRSDRDSMTILYLPNAEAKLSPVTVPLDASATTNIASLAAELDKAFPILALLLARDMGGSMSGYAIQNMLGDAVAQVESTRKNIDPVIAQLFQMMLTMCGIHGFEGFRQINKDSYDKGQLEISVASRPVMEINLSPAEKVAQLPAISGLPEGSKRQSLLELGYTEELTETIIADDKVDQEEKTRSAMRALGDSAFGTDDDDEDVTDEDTETDTTQEETDTSTQIAA